MSFCKTNELIKEGDTAIIYLSFNQLYPIKVKKGQYHNGKYGSLKHNDIIGKPYGSKIKCTQGSAHVLQGSPEIWTICLPHRTQILYTPDISMITLQLELKPGSIVIESGTGSASLSHAIIRTIFPTGHLHTFEFHQQRHETAQKEFEEHGVSDYATVYHRDVCSDGFGVEDLADAVFLDLPSPWKVLPSAKAALKRQGGRICSFSPCIEQVQKTVLEMTQLGFTDVFTVEVLRRVLCVKKYELTDFNFDMDNRPARREEVKQAEEAKEECHENEIEEEEEDKEETLEDDKETTTKRKHENNNNNKKNDKRGKKKSEESESDEDLSVKRSTSIYSAKAINQQPGHTGYLTFATLLHKDYINKK